LDSLRDLNVAFLGDGDEIGNMAFMGFIFTGYPAVNLPGIDAEVASDSVLPARPMKSLAKQT